MEATRRRTMLLAAAALLGTAPAVRAEAGPRPWRIGFLTNGTPTSAGFQIEAFVHGLKELGWVEGRHFTVEARWADGRLERLPVLVAELLAQQPDLIFAPSGVAAQAVKRSGTSTPIVFAFAPDPVGQGFAVSLARPGGNMTGLTSTHAELSAKRLELLKELLPTARRVGMLYFMAPSPAGVAEQLAQTEHAARLLGLETVAEEAPRVEDFERALTALHRRKPDALIVIENPMFFTNRLRLAELAAALRIPAVYNAAEYVHAGGLMSYGASYAELARRAASYAVRILEGRPPGELPIERPTRFELTINAKTARAIGVAIPTTVRLRADAVVD